MRKKLILAAALFLLTTVCASADPAKKGIDALRKNHYEEAVVFFSSNLSQAGKPQDALFNLNFGIALAENAKLYRDLHALSVKLHMDYLERIASITGKDKSRYARLYLARTLLEAGKVKEAAGAFEGFISDKTVRDDHRDIAKAGLALAYHRLGMKKKALSIWGQIKSSDPEVLSELARAYTSAGTGEKHAVAMADKALGLVKASKKRPAPIVTANLLGVYAAAGLVDRSFEALAASGGPVLEDYSYEERIAVNKTIRFYDTRLLADLGAFYGRAAVKFLEAASADARLKGVAWFYLAETYGLLNDFTASERARERAIASGALPEQLKYRAELIGVENLLRAGKKDSALRRLNGYYSGNPAAALLAETLLACSRLEPGPGCREAASKAEAVASGLQGGKELAVFNQALGRYFLFENDPAKAVRYMEDGRDKSNKNKIEFNDPKMLAALSEAYCGTKQYSEALEIFFEMSRHFPAVRQLQVVLQGIYSMEHRSAGDVKIL
jgi:predicted Zn-dependent protease